MRALVDLRQVSFAYRRRPVLADVGLSIVAGETLCLLGPNGAGKSTLVKILSGALSPTTGEVAFEPTMSRRHIGLVPQDIALFPWLTARENCRAFARFAGLGWSDARTMTRTALALVGCGDVADMPVRRLSGGYRRRINIAAALVAKPRLLVLDEPTVGIDLEARLQIASIVRKLRSEGIAILLVTHDFVEADAVADRIAFLQSGRLIACDRPSALVDRIFGRAKRMEIVLPDVPDQTTRRHLQELGAVPCNDNTSWQAFGDIDGWNADAVARRLTEKGVAFDELRLRIPGAEALYGVFCGEAGVAS